MRDTTQMQRMPRLVAALAWLAVFCPGAWGDDIAKATTVVLKGRAVLEGTSVPVVGAQIRLISGDIRKSQVTDEEGRFAFEGLVAGRLCRLDVDVPARAEPQVRPSRRPLLVTTPADQTALEVIWALPAHRRLIVAEPDLRPTRKLYPLIGVQFLAEDGSWRFGEVQDVEYGDGSVAVSISRPGTWRVAVSPEPFVLRQSTQADMSATTSAARVELLPLRKVNEHTYLRLVGAHGAAAAGARVRVSHALPGPEGIEFVADGEGLVDLGRANVEGLWIRCEHRDEAYDGFVRFGEGDDINEVVLSPKIHPED